MKILFMTRDKNSQLVRDVLDKNISNIYGFFLLSLKTFSKVHNLSLSEFFNINLSEKFDHIILSAKLLNSAQDRVLIMSKIKNMNKKISILSDLDNPKKLQIMFDVLKNHKLIRNIKNIFILNVHKVNLNLQKKFQQETNINVIMSHYGLGMSGIIQNNLLHKNFLSKNENNFKKNSIFFAGSNDNQRKTRNAILFALNKLDIKNSKIITYDLNDHQKSSLSPQSYIQETCNSIINLVLAGQYNNITYRFYEVSYLNKFYLIDNHFLDLEVSNYYLEAEEFVFHNFKDLKEKIHFFLDNPQKLIDVQNKQVIAFNNFYNVNHHGGQILKYLLK